jgi:dihydrofolate reductase
MISLIAAMSENRVIGREGGLPWHLPDDMKFFMRTTRGHYVVMGRKTWESMAGALKDRTNIIITRRKDYSAEGAMVVHSLDEALRRSPVETEEVFVVGGEAIFAEAMPIAQRMYLTHVHAEVKGDAHFPAFDERRWRVEKEVHHPADERHSYSFTIRQYERR